MSTAIAKSGELEETSLGKLRARAAALELEVQGLEGSLAASRLRRENLVAERGPLLVPARSRKNADAQSRLRSIDEQLAPLTQDIADDDAALSDLKKELSSAQNDVERKEWEIRRAAVRRMVEVRLTGKTLAAIEKAVDALDAALKAATDEDEAIRAAMLSFEPVLHRDLKPLKMAGFERSRLAAYKLKDALPVDTREFGFNGALKGREFADGDRYFYGELLEALDRLELAF